MAWQKGAKKEIAEGWKWMRQQNPNAAKDAEAWAKENKDDMKEVDRILYRSDERYYGKTSKLHAEDAHSIASDKKHIDTDAHLTQAERDCIYDDHAYIPNEFYREGTDDDDMVRLPAELAKGMGDLTDLQREVIFRNVINGESTSIIAKEKNCSTRNIRDVCARALKVLRIAATKGKPGEVYIDAAIYILWSILVMAAIAILLAPDSAEPWMRTAVFIALPIVTVASAIMLIWKSWRSDRIRRYLSSFRKKIR